MSVDFERSLTNILIYPVWLYAQMVIFTDSFID